MTHVDKYIRKLLFEFDCVIIPEFGGLLTHHVGVGYDESSQIFKPASKRLAFNEILKIDDGLLTYYLSMGEDISREQATELIRQFVESMRSELATQQWVKIDKVGSFSSNYEGKLIFEPDYAQNYDQEWYGMDEVSAKRYDSLPNWMGQEIPPVQEAEAVVADEDYIIPLPTKNNIRWGWAAAAVVACAAGAASYFYQPTDNNLLSSLDPISLVQNLYQPFDKENNSIPPDSENVYPVSVVYFKEVKPESTSPAIKSEPEVIENVKEEAPLPAPAVKAHEDYFLIAGAFGSQRNARKLKSQLLSQGLEGASILKNNPGKYILVSAGSYKTYSQAMQDKSKLDGLTNAESWVYHRK